jgi:hypothetical protein
MENSNKIVGRGEFQEDKEESAACPALESSIFIVFLVV